MRRKEEVTKNFQIKDLPSEAMKFFVTSSFSTLII